MDARDLGESERVPGEVPNYASRLNWAIWSFTIAAGVFLGLRIYCKLSRGRSLWWDDHFLIASWVGSLFSLLSFFPTLFFPYSLFSLVSFSVETTLS